MSNVLPPTSAGIAEAGRRLREGGCVAFPTETVYGLGACALNALAVASIFSIKGRPLTDPLIVHVPDAAAAEALVVLPVRARAAFRARGALGPGPLTLVARASPELPAAITAGTGWVGVRVPALPLAHALLIAAGVPVAAPSANRFGHVSPTRAAHVLADLGAHDIAVLVGEGEDVAAAEASGVDGATGCNVGIESTVVRVGDDTDDGGVGDDDATEVVRPTLKLRILRRGGMSAAALREALIVAGVSDAEILFAQPAAQTEAGNAVTADGAAASTSGTPVPGGVQGGKVTEGDGIAAAAGMVAPGMLLTHYAPDVPATLVRRRAASDIAATGNVPLGDLSATVIVDYGAQLFPFATSALAYVDMASDASAATAARGLFAALRWAEVVPGAKRVLLADPRGIDDGEAAEAVRDRLYRAASGRQIEI